MTVAMVRVRSVRVIVRSSRVDMHVHVRTADKAFGMIAIVVWIAMRVLLRMLNRTVSVLVAVVLGDVQPSADTFKECATSLLVSSAMLTMSRSVGAR